VSLRLRSQINSCQRCQLGELTAEQEWKHVPWSGTAKSGVAVIGEAPGRDEALAGRPFVGRAGTVLQQGLDTAHLNRDEVWVMNVICCRPPDNNFESAQRVGAVEACRPWFNAQLDASGAWLVVLVGKAAYQAVFDDTQALGNVRGKGQWMDGRLWVPTWHPAYVLRNQGEQVAIEYFSDFRKVGEVARGEYDLGSPKVSQVMGEQLEISFPGEKIRESIDRKGWVRLYSHVIEDHLLVVDESKNPRVPEAWAGEPRWTTNELLRVGWGRRLRVSREEFARINLAKRVLGATVVIT
jgi:uracil-DNA glycosylase